MAISECRARHARDDTEDGAQPIIDSVDGITDPAGRLPLSFVTSGEYLVQCLLSLVSSDSGKPMGSADQITESLVVLLLVLQHVMKDREARCIAQLLHLFRIFRDIATLVDLEPAKCKIWPDPIFQRSGFTVCSASILRLLASQSYKAFGPKVSVMLFSGSQSFQSQAALRICLPRGKTLIGVVTHHLCLPIALERYHKVFLLL